MVLVVVFVLGSVRLLPCLKQVFKPGRDGAGVGLAGVDPGKRGLQPVQLAEQGSQGSGGVPA